MRLSRHGESAAGGADEQGRRIAARHARAGMAALVAVLAMVAVPSSARSAPSAAVAPAQRRWAPNDPGRPLPPTLEPRGAVLGLAPPPDATVLFDGHGLGAWEVASNAGGWTEQDGVMIPGGFRFNKLLSKARFGSMQLHLEFREPSPAAGSGQHRGNSGVFLMGVYEIQLLDSVDNPTYADGTLGAIYGQTPPRVIAARAPGEWQSLDVIFDAPRFAGARVQSPPYATVILNGIVIHDHQEIYGDTSSRPTPLGFATRLEEGPIGLQDHGTATDRVAFRNIWVRPIGATLDVR